MAPIVTQLFANASRIRQTPASSFLLFPSVVAIMIVIGLHES